MLFSSKVLFAALSLCALDSVSGKGSEDDNARLLKRNGRKGEPFRSHAKIGQRSLPNFQRLLPEFSEDGMLSQGTKDTAKAVPADSKNRDLGFNDAKFWSNYLYSGQVSSLPPTYAPVKATYPPVPDGSPPTYAPIPDGTNAPVPPPTFYPVPQPPTEAPVCQPIGKSKF